MWKKLCIFSDFSFLFCSVLHLGSHSQIYTSSYGLYSAALLPILPNDGRICVILLFLIQHKITATFTQVFMMVKVYFSHIFLMINADYKLGLDPPSTGQLTQLV